MFQRRSLLIAIPSLALRKPLPRPNGPLISIWTYFSTTPSHGVASPRPHPRRGGRDLSARYRPKYYPDYSPELLSAPLLSPQGHTHARASAAAERIVQEAADKKHFVLQDVPIPIKPKEPESDGEYSVVFPLLNNNNNLILYWGSL